MRGTLGTKQRVSSFKSKQKSNIPDTLGSEPVAVIPPAQPSKSPQNNRQLHTVRGQVWNTPSYAPRPVTLDHGRQTQSRRMREYGDGKPTAIQKPGRNTPEQGVAYLKQRER